MTVKKQGLVVVVGMIFLIAINCLGIPDKLGEIIFSVMPDNISSVGISIMAIFAEVISYFQYFVYMCAISIVYYKSSNKHIYIKNNIQNFIIWGLWVVIEIVIIRLFAVIGGVVESMLVYTQIYRIVRVGLTSIRFAVIIIFYNRCYKQVHTSINVNKTNQKLKLVIARQAKMMDLMDQVEQFGFMIDEAFAKVKSGEIVPAANFNGLTPEAFTGL